MEYGLQGDRRCEIKSEPSKSEKNRWSGLYARLDNGRAASRIREQLRPLIISELFFFDLASLPRTCRNMEILTFISVLWIVIVNPSFFSSQLDGWKSGIIEY
jgi:hypothetical protein